MSHGPRAYTAEEVRAKLFAQVNALVGWWANEQRAPTAREKLEGLAFSIFSTLDGATLELPPMDLVLRPHPDDQNYCVERRENWYEDGMAINSDVQLHEEYSKIYRRGEA